MRHTYITETQENRRNDLAEKLLGKYIKQHTNRKGEIQHVSFFRIYSTSLPMIGSSFLTKRFIPMVLNSSFDGMESTACLRYRSCLSKEK